MTNYVVVIRHEQKHSKIRYQGKDTIISGTSPRMALRNWLNANTAILEPISVYESYTANDVKELICWVKEK